MMATTLNPRFQDAGLDGTCGAIIRKVRRIPTGFFTFGPLFAWLGLRHASVCITTLWKNIMIRFFQHGRKGLYCLALAGAAVMAGGPAVAGPHGSDGDGVYASSKHKNKW